MYTGRFTDHKKSPRGKICIILLPYHIVLLTPDIPDCYSLYSTIYPTSCKLCYAFGIEEPEINTYTHTRAFNMLLRFNSTGAELELVNNEVHTFAHCLADSRIGPGFLTESTTVHSNVTPVDVKMNWLSSDRNQNSLSNW